MKGIKDRLSMIIKMNNLNASSFADRVGVQRSSVSHILTGRNKPSLDFIQKTLKEFPRINGDWLITGRSKIEEKLPQNEIKNNTQQEITPSGTANNSNQHSEQEENKEIKKIKKIIVFYTDNSFEEFKHN